MGRIKIHPRMIAIRTQRVTENAVSLFESADAGVGEVVTREHSGNNKGDWTIFSTEGSTGSNLSYGIYGRNAISENARITPRKDLLMAGLDHWSVHGWIHGHCLFRIGHRRRI